MEARWRIVVGNRQCARHPRDAARRRRFAGNAPSQTTAVTKLIHAAAVLGTALILAGQAALAADESADPVPNPYAALTTEINRLSAQIAEHPRQAELRFERARLLEANGFFDGAMRDYRWLLDNRPEQPEAYNNLARLHAARGELNRAISLLERGLATHPVYHIIFDNLRSLYESMAQRAYHAALTEPDSPDDVEPVDEDFGVNLTAVKSIDSDSVAIAPARPGTATSTPNSPPTTSTGPAGRGAARMVVRGE